MNNKMMDQKDIHRMFAKENKNIFDHRNTVKIFSKENNKDNRINPIIVFPYFRNRCFHIYDAANNKYRQPYNKEHNFIKRIIFNNF